MMFKRFLSLVLVLCCLAGCLPLPAGAEEPPDLPISGTCGDNLTWTLDEGGTLTISGTGDMTDYEYTTPSNSKGISTAPWFVRRSEIKKLEIGSDVTSIGACAFVFCDQLSEIIIPDNVVRIGQDSFRECTNLSSISLSKSLTEIPSAAFIKCKSLQKVAIPDEVKILGNHAFSECETLSEINIPDGVTKIGTSTFSFTSLPSIHLPSSLTSIGHTVFAGCYELTSVTIPDSVTELGVRMFEGCGKLEKVVLPANISLIPSDLFIYCYKLPNIIIPSKVTKIDKKAFLSCQELKAIQLPSSLKDIGDYAFDICKSLSDVYFMGTRSQWDQIVIGTHNDALFAANIHCIDDVTSYTITLNPTGGTVSPTTLTVTNGATYGTLPAPTRSGYTFDGWYTAEAGGEKITTDTTVNLSEDQTLFAHWKQNGFTLRGTITGHKNVTYKEIRAWLKNLDGESFDAVVQPGVTDSQTGKTAYAYEVAAPLGQYNFIIETKNSDDYISVITKRVDLKKNGQVFDVNLPSGKTKTEVKKNGSQVPNTLVGGLDELITQNEMAGNQEVEVTLTANAVAESDPGAVKIKEAAPNQILSFLDLSIQKKINSTISPITDTGSLKIEIVVPFQKGKKNNVKVYRFHNGNVDVLTETRSPSGEFIVVGENSISIYASKFSVYAIGYSDKSSSGPSQGGGYPPISCYSVNLEKPEHGTVTATPTSIYSGGTVTLTVKPEDGYKLDTLTVTDSQDKVVEITEKSGKYTFNMPSSHVMVKAMFVPVQTASPTPVPTPTPTQVPTPTPAPTAGPWKNPFPDVEATGWYIKAVEYVCVEGLMTGYTNGKFGPNDQITRAQFAQLFYNKERQPSAEAGQFTDVKPGQWYTDAVNWAAEKGVVHGVGGGKFAPEASITREQMAAMLWRYAGSPKPKKASLQFNDAGKVSDYAREAMCWATENTVLNGTGGGMLDPLGTAKRCEVAQMLMNYLAR
ncbi:leucine-rich repeat protein [Oscillospiraceae bacterium 42-9]